jgi:uncharacterized damage-inducible protein DinB
MSAEIRLLLEVLDHAFAGRSWHGTTLTGALRGVTPARALWRPGRNRHTIWDLVLHAAYWKYVVRCRVTGVRPPDGFPRAPSNWPEPPARPDAARWRADVRLLKRMHAELRAAVAALPPRQLRSRSPAGTWTYAEMISGLAAHDLYHTGQIQLIKRLAVRR